MDRAVGPGSLVCRWTIKIASHALNVRKRDGYRFQWNPGQRVKELERYLCSSISCNSNISIAWRSLKSRPSMSWTLIFLHSNIPYRCTDWIWSRRRCDIPLLTQAQQTDICLLWCPNWDIWMRGDTARMVQGSAFEIALCSHHSPSANWRLLRELGDLVKWEQSPCNKDLVAASQCDNPSMPQAQ